MVSACEEWQTELAKLEAEVKEQPSSVGKSIDIEGLIDKAVSNRMEFEKRILEAESRMLEVSEHRAHEKAEELFDRYRGEISKAIANEAKPKDKEVKDIEPKTYMYDPFQLMESLGYKERIMSMSYDTLRLMSERNPIVAAIINTRIHQVTSFSRPPKDDFDVGYEIKLRDDEAEPIPSDLKKIKELEDLMESTGLPGLIEEEERDNFDHFLSKEVRDSLTYDQACFEVVPGRSGKPVAFYAIDASTIRYATTPRLLQRISGYGAEQLNEIWKREMVGIQTGLGDKTRQPKPEEVRYVQIISGKVMNTYSEKEMGFGIRNPRTSIHYNCYGVGELEILVSVITSHLWAEEYNKRFFSTGSAPKGFIHFESAAGIGIPQDQLQAFRRQWHAQVTGVWNAWRTPIISSPAKLQYTNLQMSNRQMEFTNWIEYLIKLMCAVYLIDPAEINFDLKGAAGQNAPMFESPSEQKLKMSRDRGLKPLLRFLESELNKNLIFQIDPRFEFEFVGLDSKSEKEIQELRIKSLEKYKVVDEIRAEDDLEPIGEEKGGDLIMDSSYINYRTQKLQMEAMSGGGAPPPGGEAGFDFGTEEAGEEGGDRLAELEGTMDQMSMERSGTEEKAEKRPESRNTQRLGELDKMISGLKSTQKSWEEPGEKLLKSLDKYKKQRETRGRIRGK